MKKFLLTLMFAAFSVAYAAEITFYQPTTVTGTIDTSLTKRNEDWICLDLHGPVRGKVSAGDKIYSVSEQRAVLLYALSADQIKKLKASSGKQARIVGQFEPAPSDRYPRAIILTVSEITIVR